MEFGLMFFSSVDSGSGTDKYSLLLAATRFADQHGFRCVWTPERHFHPFGGLFPNPALISAALAAVTSRIQLRAGSLISPLHDPIRIAEDWAVVDNLSGGRVAVSFGAGWNINDFLFFPERYERRHAVLHEQIATVQALWRGETLCRRNSQGKEVEVAVYPRPLQGSLPIWITSSGNVETFIQAGAMGANVLTHLMGQDIEQLAGKIRRYREARELSGLDPATGVVSLMLHTFIDADAEAAREKARDPLRAYLRSAVDLERRAADGGGVISGGHRVDPDRLPEDTLDDLVEVAFQRYCRTSSLIGSRSTCERLVWDLAEIGVNEIACLIDFGIEEKAVLESLHPLDELRRAVASEAIEKTRHAAVASFLEDPVEDWLS